jgi:MoaA/NifB/PqqE/SkfB family radical SAM enzyme
MENTAALQLLSPGPLQKVRLDLTTECNLRCVYCAVSQSTYQGANMPGALVSKATTTIVELSHQHQFDAVYVNGHGETTFMPGWSDVCKTLLERELPLVLTTNLAKAYSREELEVLARMNVIAVSIDTCDQDLLRRMRRKVDLRQIVTNINLIRATALRLETTPPTFEFSCGLYDQNSLLIEDFARFAIALWIHSVGFWNLSSWNHEKFPYENTDVPESDRAFPLDNLDRSELRPRLDAIQRAIAILNANGVIVQVNGNFIETLSRQCNQVAEQTVPMDGLELPKGTTRDCLDPWTYAELETNGDVRPCCAHGSIGNLGRADLLQILDDEPIRRLRANLLHGTTDTDCTNCTLRAPIKTTLLQEKVRMLLFEPSTVNNPVLSQAGGSASSKVNNLLTSALGHMRAGRNTTAWFQVSQALAIDPGIHVGEVNEETIRTYLGAILTNIRFPSTVSSLAAIYRETGDRKGALALMQRYLELAPDAVDRQHVLADIALEQPKPVTRPLLETVWLWFRRTVRLRTRVRLIIRKLQGL